MGFLQVNELYENQRTKVSFIKTLSKFLLVNLFRLIPLKFFPNQVYFIYSHHIFDDEFERFKSSIIRLKKKFTFVPLEEAVALSSNGKLNKKYISLSFDDGMQNNMKAASFLKDQNIQAHFFINPEVVDKHDDFDYIQAHCQEKLHLSAIRFFNWEAVNQIIAMGHGIGNHGLSHKKLSTCSREELEAEIEGSRMRLDEQLNLGDLYFAWCYGTTADITDEALDLINQNHQEVVSAIRGFNQTKGPYLLRDLVIWYYSYHRIEFFYKLNCMKRWK